MVLLAFSLQDQIDKYGTYVGIAAFFGLAVLTLLYFAQAREVKRLREWAGRAPERAVELELAVQEHAHEVRRVPATPAPAPQPVPVQQLSQTVPATNGVVKLKPAEVAALAFARSAGVHEPHEPRAHPVATTATAPPAEVAAAGAAVAAGEPAGARAVNGGGAGHPPVPKPATPAARRVEQPPLPPLPPRRVAAAAAGRRTATAPPPRESSSRAVIITAVIGVLVLGGAVYGMTRIVGGGDEPARTNTPVTTPTPESGGGDEKDPATTATPEPEITKETALVGIFNATGANGLAATNEGLLLTEGYPADNIDTGNLDQRQASVVLYARGARDVADGVADVLGISSVKQLADDPQAQSRVEQSETKWNVVAIVGADKT